MGEQILYAAFAICHGIEQLSRCRQRYIQVVTISYEFDLPYVFKSERITVGDYADRKMIGNVVYKKFFPSRTSKHSNCGISTSTTSSATDISTVDPGVGSINSTVLLDLTNVRSNLIHACNLLWG